MSRESWRAFSLTLLAVGLGLGACSRSSTNPIADAAGSYVLSTVNGSSLPATIGQSADTTVDVTSGKVTLSRDRSASYFYNVRYTVDTASTPALQADDGTWTIKGNNVTAMWRQGGTDTFVQSGNELTKTVGGLTFVFLR